MVGGSQPFAARSPKVGDAQKADTLLELQMSTCPPLRLLLY